ncbi:MAG: glycoside hydrolase family 140 protein [Eubacteriales bacterium]
MKLKVHDGNRFLMTTTGEPFFYLADTAWELFHGLSREEADEYLSLRAAQGFNTIQVAALAEFEGLSVPNRYGRCPLLQSDGVYDPTLPDCSGEYHYWAHADYVIQKAAEYGLFVALLPTWGDKFNQKWGKGPEIFDPDNAFVYAKWLGERYRAQWNIIWVLGGDRPLESPLHHAVIDAMAAGVREGDHGEHLITFHPCGGRSSADDVGDRAYIDFHTTQSSHALAGYASWSLLRRTGRAVCKPFMDMETRYEDHPACFDAKIGYLWDAHDIRQNTYWNLMEGVCGHTYGNHAVWSFCQEPSAYFPYRWQEVLHHPGVREAVLVKQLRLSRPYFEFRHAPELVEDDPYIMAHFSAGRGNRYAFIYTPLGQPIRAHLKNLTDDGRAVKVSWFDPRTGAETLFGVVPQDDVLLVPPTQGKGCDWVLICDVV